MNVIDFIEKDTKKIVTSNRFRKILFLVIILVSLTVGYGTRGDFDEAFEVYNLLPSGLLIVIAYGYLVLPAKNILLGSFLVISLLQAQTQVSLLKFQDITNFWNENLHCMLIGSLGGLIMLMMSSFIFFRFFPLSGRKTIAMYSVLVAMVPTILLSLHCPGALHSHIMISHWGTSGVFFGVQFLVMGWVMRILKRRVV